MYLTYSLARQKAREWFFRLQNLLYSCEQQEERLLQEKSWIEAKLKAVRANKANCMNEISQLEFQNPELCELKKAHSL